MENLMIIKQRQCRFYKDSFNSNGNEINKNYSRVKNNYFSTVNKEWTRFPRIRNDSLSDHGSIETNTIFLPSEEKLYKQKLSLGSNEIPTERINSSPFYWYFKKNNGNLPLLKRSDSRKSENDAESLFKRADSIKSYRSSVSVDYGRPESVLTSDDDIFMKQNSVSDSSVKKKKSFKKKVSIQEPSDFKPPIRKCSILSEDELKNMHLSDKFIKEAKNMMFNPKTNSFYPVKVTRKSN
ncbi:unnamed protein product [Brachionus calyciflorus]|uniref:Uncharacterized protein n=1 Tax=Brachionus calyciflorus TaxID=104777 RepID=A0A813M8Y5_9BILA|nr:unnamed protein product [Brachionus calyciflorus]